MAARLPRALVPVASWRYCASAALVLLSATVASVSATEPVQVLDVSQDTVSYRCPGGKLLTATFIFVGGRAEGGAPFVFLDFDGKHYALSVAPSGSGARYTSEIGPAAGLGIEFWEHQGEARLSRIRPTGKASLIAKCRLFEK